MIDVLDDVLVLRKRCKCIASIFLPSNAGLTCPCMMIYKISI